MDNTAAAAAALPWWTPLVTLATPALGVLGVYVASRFTSKNSTRATKVSETEAETNQFSALTEGFVEQLRALREDLKEQRELRDTDRLEISKLTDRVQANEEREQRYLEHILLLEGLVPNPPGPPVRPWLTTIAAPQQ